MMHALPYFLIIRAAYEVDVEVIVGGSLVGSRLDARHVDLVLPEPLQCVLQCTCTHHDTHKHSSLICTTQDTLCTCVLFTGAVTNCEFDACFWFGSCIRVHW